MKEADTVGSGYDEDVDHLEVFGCQYAEVIRNFLRALAADNPTNSICTAAELISSAQTYLDRLPPDVGWHQILERAIEQLRTPVSANRLDREYLVLARAGLKFMAELTTSDGFSAARTSKARQDMDHGVRYLQAARDLRRQGFD